MTNLFADTDSMNGVVVINEVRHADGRGWLSEFFRHDDSDALVRPAMGYVSMTDPRRSRGPHEHTEQTDRFFFTGIGAFLLVLWDNRETSPTYGKRMCVRTKEGEPLTVIVPPRVVHAYCCVSKGEGLIVNVPDRLYRGPQKKENVDEVRHEDGSDSPFLKDFLALTEESERK